MNTTQHTARILDNARRLGTRANETVIALDLVAPVTGRVWTSMCCSCLDEHDPAGEWPAHRVNTVSWGYAGDCWHCPDSGRDVLVVSMPTTDLERRAA